MAWYNPFRRTYSNQELVVFRFMGKVRLFAGFTNAELSGLQPYLNLRQYKQGEVVFFREDPAAALYILKSGEITLSLDIANRLETLTTQKAYGFFGEEALLPNQKRIYNAIVTSDDAQLYVLPSANLHDYLERNKRGGGKLFTNLAKVRTEFMVRLFRAYREDFGLFELKQAFGNGKIERTRPS